MRKTFGIAASAALMVGVLGVAPATAQDDNQVLIGYSAPDLVGAQLQIQQGLVDGATTKGWEVQTVTSNGDANLQLEQIRDYIALGVDAIVNVPEDSAGICVAVEEAKAAGIPFYTIDRAPTGCEINMTVLSDNFLAGQQAGQAAVDWLTAKYGEPTGTYLEITGNMGQNVAQLRGGGFHDIVDQYPNIEIVTKIGDWDATKGVDIVRDVASAGDLDGIYMHSDCVYTPGTLQVLGELGLLVPRDQDGHIHLSGVDGCLQTLDAIRDGTADEASSQPIPDFGKVMVDFMEQEFNGQTIEVPQTIEQADALWSPARLEASDIGPQLFLATTKVGPDNVDDARLWGNIEAATAAESE